MQNDIAIRVSNVSKKYSIGKQKDSSLRGSLKGVLNNKATQGVEFMALNDVSFDIKKGDIVGIIGKNGAGKSTLLKILSQITKPSTGRIEINGRVASLLEVGTGFHPELTGRENVYLNGTILGMSRKEVSSKFDEIVEFSGVEKFIDTPVKHYSSGMYVRLAFAVAAHLEPEILIIDEVLAVGDAEFQNKCLGKMKDVAGEGRTVIFVSHNLAVINSLCKKGIYLSDGVVKDLGPIEEVIKSYDLNSIKITQEISISDGYYNISEHENKKYDKRFGVQKAKLLCNNKPSNSIYSGSNFKLECYVINDKPLKEPVFGIVIKDNHGISLIGLHNMITGQNLTLEPFQSGVISVEIPFFPIFGDHRCTIDIYYGNKTENFDIIDDAICFDLLPADIYNSSKLPEIRMNKIAVKDVNIKLISI